MHPNPRSPDRPLRVGYVSPDLRSHVIGLYAEPVLEHHDRDRHEVFCYSDAAGTDEVTSRLKAHAASWRDTRGLDDARLADLVRRDAIDVLVDLTLHMSGNRLLAFARRPAPVQVTYLAYPGTSGMSAMGYKVTDAHLDPTGMTEQYHSESLLRLPGSYWCYKPPAGCPEPNPPPSGGGGPITFGALNSFTKVNPDVIALWAKILVAVPGSRLLALFPGGEHDCADARDLFRRGGIPDERVRLLERKPRAQFLRSFHDVDISLDPFPYNGHTTTIDSLWMGVPVVTLAGTSAVGRAGVSILINAGTPELIAQTPRDYVALAVGLAHDRPRLARLRASLRDKVASSPITDAPRLARDIESLYRHAWQRWCAAV